MFYCDFRLCVGLRKQDLGLIKDSIIPWHWNQYRNHSSSAFAPGGRPAERSTCRCRRCWCVLCVWNSWAHRSCFGLSWASDAAYHCSACCSSLAVESGSTWNTAPRARCCRPSLACIHTYPCKNVKSEVNIFIDRTYVQKLTSIYIINFILKISLHLSSDALFVFYWLHSI